MYGSALSSPPPLSGNGSFRHNAPVVAEAVVPSRRCASLVSNAPAIVPFHFISFLQSLASPIFVLSPPLLLQFIFRAPSPPSLPPFFLSSTHHVASPSVLSSCSLPSHLSSIPLAASLPSFFPPASSSTPSFPPLLPLPPLFIPPFLCSSHAFPLTIIVRGTC